MQDFSFNPGGQLVNTMVCAERPVDLFIKGSRCAKNLVADLTCYRLR